MAHAPRSLPPLNPASLDRIALRYVERFATTRGKLTRYLECKIRERGWDGEELETSRPDTVALAQRLADLGYIDDRAFAEGRATAMGRRGLGARRVAGMLREAGVGTEDAASLTPVLEAQALSSALSFARKRRIGPYADRLGDRAQQQKHLAAMIRAGHDFSLARQITAMLPGDDVARLGEA